MGPFSTLLNNLFSCWRPQHKTPKLLSLKLDYFFPTMTKTTEIRAFSSYRRKETVVMTRNSEIKMATIFETTVNPQMKAMTSSDQLAVTEVLLTDWLECQSEKQDDHSDYETEWSEEEDWSDEGDSDMSPENRELWDSFLNNSDPLSPLCFSCPDEVKASDSVHCDDELVPSNQETEPEWSEEEDSDWSDEGDSEMSPENSKLWDSFMNNSDPYSPLCFSCPAGLKMKASEVKQNHTPSSPTAREVEEHNPDQNTKERAKKVHFSEEVTIHNLEAWGFASKEARDGSCWMEMARDRERFKRRVEKTGELISPCLTAQHRARVLDRLRSHSYFSSVIANL